MSVRRLSDEPQETIQGAIARVIWSNDDGFCILRLADGTGLKGNMANPAIGIEYTFTGWWLDEDPKYGRQFKFVAYAAIVPRTFEAVAAYLDAHAKWVGPVVARRLVDAYGEEVLETLKRDPERVSQEIMGITHVRAMEISEMLLANEADEALQLAMNELFIGTGLGEYVKGQAVKQWGSDAPDRIRENPFALIQFRGCGFLLADRVRQKLDIPHDDPERIRAGILHVLSEAASEGHTYLPGDEFFSEAIKLLQVSQEAVWTQAQALSCSPDGVFIDEEDQAA